MDTEPDEGPSAHSSGMSVSASPVSIASPVSVVVSPMGSISASVVLNPSLQAVMANMLMASVRFIWTPSLGLNLLTVIMTAMRRCEKD